MSNKVEQLELKANQLRKDVLEVIYESKAGHIGESLSSLRYINNFILWCFKC